MSSPPIRAVALLLIAGCTGEIGDPYPGDQPRSAPDPAADPNAPPSSGPRTKPPDREPPVRELPPFAPANATLHRLTVAQYSNSVRDLLGDVEVPADLEVDTRLHGFSTVGASKLAIAPRAAEQYEAAAYQLAAQVFGDAGRRGALVGCTPADASDACTRGFIEAFGQRAWRRPLDPDEVSRWLQTAASVAGIFRDPWRGLEFVVAGMLQSPHFLYRVEIGVPVGAMRRFTGWEMASRLSYFITNTTPDGLLLAAAAQRDLDTPVGVRGAAVRLLELPEARPAIAAFFYEYFKLDRLDLLNKDPASFPQMSPTLGKSMREEILRVFDDIIFGQGGDVRNALDTRTTFVNAELARLYTLRDVPAGERFERVELPDSSPRAGVLTSGGFLALNAHATVTSPTFRGKFIRQFMLCQEIPPPPETVETRIPEPSPTSGPQTLRQRLESLHLAKEECAACHVLMDPIGFGFESFDAIGAYRTTENGLAVDPRGALDGKTFRSARELASRVKEHPRFASCIARMAYRYASGHLEVDGEERTIAEIVKAFAASGHSFKDLVVEIVASDGFRFATPEEE